AGSLARGGPPRGRAYRSIGALLPAGERAPPPCHNPARVPPVDQSPQYVTREMLAWCLVLLGAFFLAMSVVGKGQRWTMRDLLGLPTDRLKAFRHHIAQRLQAWLGFGCVFSGVSIHLYILLRKYADAKSARGALEDAGKYLLGSIGAMVLLALALHYLVKTISRKSFVDLLALVVARHNVHLED